MERMGRYGDRASRSALACWYLGHHPKSQAAQVPHARPRPPSSLLVPSQPYQPVARRDTQHLLCIDLFIGHSYSSPPSSPPSPCLSPSPSPSSRPLLVLLRTTVYRLRHRFFVIPSPGSTRQFPSGETKDLPSPQTAAAPQACALPCVMLLPPCVTVG